MASTYGIFQSDIIIRTALQAAIKDLRDNPWLLDYVFISLPQDALTVNDYGESEVDKAKKWFLNTDIPVIVTPRIDEAKMPAISIALQESSETGEATLGDVNYEPILPLPDTAPLAGPLHALGYNQSTGHVSVRDSDLNGITLAPGMIMLDGLNNQYPITDVYDIVNGVTVFVIAPNRVIDISNMKIVSSIPMFALPLESTIMKESYQIGCHVNTDFTHLLYLHSIVVFSLLRYKQRLLEGRGFERSTISSSDPRLDAEYQNELIYERYVSLSGFVRQWWPKDMVQTIQNVVPEIQVVGAGKLPNDTSPKIASWMGDLDSLPSIGSSVNASE